MLSGMTKTELNIFSSEAGSVLHCLKKTDIGYHGFGEVYFSSVKKDIFKGWKLHKHMTLNLVVPVGEVLFCFKDERENSGTFNKTYQIKLSQDPYFRLTVPARIWFGFKGIEHGLNLICNVADIPHDPNEVLMREINEIKMDIDI